MSARGAAVAIETLLGLAGRSGPKTGLFLPETLIEPAHLVKRLETFGVTVRTA